MTDHKSAPPRQRSFYDDVGRLIKAGKGFYDDGTPIDYKEIQLEIKGVGEGIFECTKVSIPRPPKREWVGLSTGEAREFYESDLSREELIHKIDEFLEEKNT